MSQVFNNKRQGDMNSEVRFVRKRTVILGQYSDLIAPESYVIFNVSYVNFFQYDVTSLYRSIWTSHRCIRTSLGRHIFTA